MGTPRENPWKALAATGIDKRPVQHSVTVTGPGRKGSGAVGLTGDRAYDVKHHGGADQALSAYAREDLDTWQGELGRRLHNGRSFGENLTTVGVDADGALVGERWRIGTGVVLEVSCTRIPCITFEGWLGEPGWLERSMEGRRPGAYLRVIDEGRIRVGDDIEVVFRPEHDITVELTFRGLDHRAGAAAQARRRSGPPRRAKALLGNRARRHD